MSAADLAIELELENMPKIYSQNSKTLKPKIIKQKYFYVKKIFSVHHDPRIVPSAIIAFSILIITVLGLETVWASETIVSFIGLSCCQQFLMRLWVFPSFFIFTWVIWTYPTEFSACYSRFFYAYFSCPHTFGIRILNILGPILFQYTSYRFFYKSWEIFCKKLPSNQTKICQFLSKNRYNVN